MPLYPFLSTCRLTSQRATHRQAGARLALARPLVRRCSPSHTQNPGLQRLHSKRGGGCSHSEKPLTGALELWRGLSGNEQHKCLFIFYICG